MLLEVEHLSISFRDRKVVDDLGFYVDAGEVLGLVGESGSGKSLTSLAILRLLDPAARVEGSVRFEGTDLLRLKPEQMRPYRGSKIAMIFQEPMTALNPVMTVGRQIADSEGRTVRTERNGMHRRSFPIEKIIGGELSVGAIGGKDAKRGGGKSQERPVPDSPQAVRVRAFCSFLIHGWLNRGRS